MAQWWQYHQDPHVSYYLFLRRIYHMPAFEAWKIVKRRNLPPTTDAIARALRPRPGA